MPSYTFTHRDATRVVVDLTGQVLFAEIVPQVDLWQLRSERRPLDPAANAAGIAVLNGGDAWPSPVHPSVAATGIAATFTPLLALTAKAKRFDDRLVTTVERLAHDGAGEQAGLYELLARVRAELAEGTRARGLLDAAAHLAAGTMPQLGPGNIRARKWLAGFLPDAKRSRPVGFYNETEELQRIFRHDRLLQSELTPDDAAPIRNVLEEDSSLLAAYRRHLDIATKLTGPLTLPSVDVASAHPIYAVLPPSDSAEGRLVKQLFGEAPIPDGFELARELVTRIRDGRLRTEPTPDDGWYAHQFHAIAALVTPDATGLQIGPRYRQELEDSFRALFVLNRETHVKQLDVPAVGGAAPLYVTPKISVEPLPELYARTASAYEHVRARLTGLFGEHVLGSTELGDTGIDALTGLLEIETLFRGAESVSRFELGQAPEVSAEQAVARAVFKAWQRRSPEDPDLRCDLRVAVPVWFDILRKTVRICATVGIETRTLNLDFVQRPDVRIFGEPDTPEFASSSWTILSLLTVECDVREPPTREELRAICDREKTPSAIRAALEAR